MKFSKQLLIALLTTFVATLAQAQVKLMPINKINDGYLSMQNNIIPIYESLDSGDFCLLDHQWCNNQTPKIQRQHFYDGGLNENLIVAILDHQLIIAERKTLDISNGFFKLKNLDGAQRYFNRTGFTTAKNLLKLQQLPLEAYAVKDPNLLQEVEVNLLEDEDEQSHTVATSALNQTKWISRYEALLLLQEKLVADENGMVAVMVDGVLMYMHKNSLGALVNMTRAIVVSG